MGEFLSDFADGEAYLDWLVRHPDQIMIPSLYTELENKRRKEMMYKAEMECYAQKREALRTGDLILMEGNSVFSYFIKKFTKSKWSHVGLVIKISDLDMILLWESCARPHGVDVQTGTVKAGVQLSPLSKRIDECPGEVAVRRLKTPLTGTDKEKLAILRQQWKNRSYETDGAQLAKSALDLTDMGKNDEDLNSFFCSELVAESYKRIGLIKSDEYPEPSNEYTPADFGGKIDFDYFLNPIETLKHSYERMK